jgi:multiple sugar transport system permease protein
VAAVENPLAAAAPSTHAARVDLPVRLWGRVGFPLVIVLFLAFCLAPFVWLADTSIKTADDLYSIPPKLLPIPADFSNYLTIWQGRPFFQNIVNSAIVSAAATTISLLVGSFCAYALARLRFRGKSLILAMVLAVSMFPGIAIVSPLYLFFSELGLINTRLALIFPYVTFTLPLCVWLLTAFFRDLPFELEEAAKVDGATPIQAFWKVIVPLAAPGVFTAAILIFIFAWNEFLFARTFMNHADAYTVPPAISMFEGTGTFVIPWAQITAASVVVTVPLIVLVLAFQRRIISGLTAGAVKG